MEVLGQELMDVYRRLYRHYGNLHWWPGNSPLEVSVGAILTQNTAWSNVEKAIGSLKREKVLSVAALGRLSHSELAHHIKASGYFNVKARRLMNFISFLRTRYQGRFKKMTQEPMPDLRDTLLSINGIGPETADSILLYALERAVFVIDAYTKRIFSRHGLISYDESYETYQQFFMKALPPDVPLYNQYHAMFVYTGKDFCRSRPRCDGCPLNGWRSVPSSEAAR